MESSKVKKKKNWKKSDISPHDIGKGWVSHTLAHLHRIGDGMPVLSLVSWKTRFLKTLALPIGRAANSDHQIKLRSN